MSKLDSLEEQKWKGHLVRAIDGTKLTLPRTEEILDKFPISKSHFGKNHYPKANLVACTEISTGKITHTLLGENFLSEVQSLKSLITQLSPGNISLMDRGFHGKSLWLEFKDHRQYFIARFKSAQKQQMKEFNPKLRDQIFTTIEKVSKREVTLRIIKIMTKKNQIPIYLITNLLDKKKYKRKELSELYLKRQVVEESFKQMKKNLTYKLEYRAKKLNNVLQEIYASVLATSIASIFRASQQSLTTGQKIISFLGAEFMLKQHFFRILFKNYTESTGLLVQEILESHFHYRQVDRSYPRYSKQAAKKWVKEKRMKKYKKNKSLSS